MPPKRVIADSDDSDDEPMSPTGWCAAATTPEPEPLSPIRPNEVDKTTLNSHAHASDTDSSFFAHVYDNQQEEALQQSLLIESIVRQTQKASASSSSDVLSLPRHQSRMKPRTISSSGNNFTSPMVIERPINNQQRSTEDGTQFTPRRSPPRDMWDVPSSPDVASPKEKGSSKHRITGRADRTVPQISSERTNSPSAGTEPAAQARGISALNVDSGSFLDPSSRATKRQKIQSHDLKTEDPSDFYIEQSNLTTMQKLEYQKIGVANSSSYPVPTLPSSKSSGGATILYSTPSRYASSGPRPPWESTPTTVRPCAQENEMIHLRSSPDEIAVGDEWVDKPALPAVVKTNKAVDPQNETLTKKYDKGNQDMATHIGDDVDELSPDGLLGGHGRDIFLDQPQSLPGTAPVGSTTTINQSRSKEGAQQPEIGAGLLAAPAECPEVALQDSILNSTKDLHSMPDTQAPEPPEDPSAMPTNKRGRKKKHQNDENSTTAAISVADKETQPTGHVESQNKPKKKRGRPRKSEPIAQDRSGVDPSQDIGPLSDGSVVPSLGTGGNQAEEGREAPGHDSEHSAKKNGSLKRKHSENDGKELRVLAQDGDEDNSGNTVAVSARIEPENGGVQNRTPLRNLNENSHCSRSNEKTLSDDEQTTTVAERNEQKGALASLELSGPEEAAGVISESVTPKGKPVTPAHTPTSQPSKAIYRVGLSKRSRIAPLLKSIKK